MAYWTQHIHRDAIRALRSLSDDNLRIVNALLSTLQVDPRPAGAHEQEGQYHISLGTVTVTYEVVDEQQIIRIVQIAVHP